MSFLVSTAVAVAALVGLRNARPSLDVYAARTLPAATATAPVRVRFAGVATLLFDDGETAWMTDGFFSRPPFRDVALTRIAPDRAAIERGLARLEVKRLAAVAPVHSHYDHAMDAPVVAERTGALLVGSESTLNLGRGLGLAEDRMKKVLPGERLTFGKWTLRFLASHHVPSALTRDGETIDAPLAPPQRASRWGEGQTWAIVVEHPAVAPMLILGSAGYEPGSLEGVHAETVFLGVGLLAKRPDEYRTAWWQEDVRRVGARLVIPIHWDDFGRPIDEPFVALPYVAGNVAATIAEVETWGRRDGIEMRMPPSWTPFEIPSGR